MRKIEELYEVIVHITSDDYNKRELPQDENAVPPQDRNIAHPTDGSAAPLTDGSAARPPGGNAAPPPGGNSAPPPGGNSAQGRNQAPQLSTADTPPSDEKQESLTGEKHGNHGKGTESHIKDDERKEKISP